MQKATLYLENTHQALLDIEANSISSVHKAKEIKLLTKLRVGFSYLKEQKVRHNF